ncbi:DUF1631 family protein [Sphaerotilus natans]|uniref:DUF1631 family protein n=1 Tax=Sphaerotilus natans TaxID=34103 RepID=UPI00406C8F93
MAAATPSSLLAAQARRLYCEQLQRLMPRVAGTLTERVRDRIAEQARTPSAHHAVYRDLLVDLPLQSGRWATAFGQQLQQAAAGRQVAPQGAGRNATRADELAIVDDASVDQEIVVSHMAMALLDKASWEFSDLRYRMAALDHRDELDALDVLRPHALARAVSESWFTAGFSAEAWRVLQPMLHEEFAVLIHEAYHEVNRWLIGQGVCPEVNLRHFIRRSKDDSRVSRAGGLSPDLAVGAAVAAARPGGLASPPQERFPSPSHLNRNDNRPGPDASTPSRWASGGGSGAGSGVGGAAAGSGAAGASAGSGPAWGGGGGSGGAARAGQPGDTTAPDSRDAHLYAPTMMADVSPPSSAGAATVPVPLRDVHDETRMMTHSPGLLRSIEQAEAVLGRLNRLVARQVPDFYSSTIAHPQVQPSPGLSAAISDAEQAVRRRFEGGSFAAGAASGVPVLSQAVAVSTPGLLQELQSRKVALKQAATTPVERATIEIVALMFQSLLTEERIPATVRVWFARLQMPVLRVAIAEPDFFATIDHPARKLIDRMGGCVMGFEVGAAGVSEPMEREIKRVVQVVEAYPDTGRRVFQTVLTEFERFIEEYFKTEHVAASKGVSLAQQIEQRETMAIQYTIEMRKMLDKVPVHDSVRQFLFHVWADVLATTAVKTSASSEQTRAMSKVASDLIWLASAKVSREERAEAIRRLPPLLKRLREGMGSAGVPMPRQDEYLQSLNNALQAAFSARTATIPTERLDELMMQLEALEDLLPEAGDIEIDESMVRDLSGHETQDLEVVAEGGSMPTPAMVAWVADLTVGNWFRLDYRDRIEPVQLAWQGSRKQFSLFVSVQGRGIMFQKHRLASFLQAGLLVPFEEESLTVRATRNALAKLDADPARLLH